MRSALLVLSILACGQPTRFPEQRWESAPPPPKPKPAPIVTKAPKPATMGMRHAPVPAEIAKRIEKRLEKKLAALAPPRYTRCPSDLSLAVARTIDGRTAAMDLPGRLSAQHLQPVRREELLDDETAIKRVLAIEAAQPVVVPSGFRSDIVALGHDPEFRLHMARCELADAHTIRRAGHDLAMAFLLGASPEVVLPLLYKSLNPDNWGPQTCRSDADCNSGCDALSKRCTSQRGRVAGMLSRAELDIEDALTRAVANRLTKEQLERDRFVPDEVIVTWIAGRYTRCGDSMCTMVRAPGKPRLVYWDRRSGIDNLKAADPEPWEVCYRETRSVTREGCVAHCDIPDQGSRRSCVEACTRACQPAPL